MATIDFDLIPEPYLDPVTKLFRPILRPKIPIKVGYKGKFDKISYDCLIDSGADSNLFPSLMGESVGINIKK